MKTAINRLNFQESNQPSCRYKTIFSAPSILHYKQITEHQDKCDFEPSPHGFHMHTTTHANQTNGYIYANSLKKIMCIMNWYFTTVFWFGTIINTV
jgi:hypothetical protein